MVAFGCAGRQRPHPLDPRMGSAPTGYRSQPRCRPRRHRRRDRPCRSGRTVDDAVGDLARLANQRRWRMVVGVMAPRSLAILDNGLSGQPSLDQVATVIPNALRPAAIVTVLSGDRDPVDRDHRAVDSRTASATHVATTGPDHRDRTIRARQDVSRWWGYGRVGGGTCPVTPPLWIEPSWPLAA